MWSRHPHRCAIPAGRSSIPDLRIGRQGGYAPVFHEGSHGEVIEVLEGTSFEAEQFMHGVVEEASYARAAKTGGFGFQPEVYVDITETIETKKRMMECHASQLQWMRRYSDMDSVEFIETVGRFRGYQAGVRFAEGFITHKSFARFPTGRALP